MADSSKTPAKGGLKVILSEEDIPGAKIPHETVEQCSVVQLKRWLLCRGAKTTGNKKVKVKNPIPPTHWPTRRSTVGRRVDNYLIL